MGLFCWAICQSVFKDIHDFLPLDPIGPGAVLKFLDSTALKFQLLLRVGLHLADIIKPLLHVMRLDQVLTVQKHQITGLYVLTFQLFIAGQDELAVAFVIPTRENCMDF